MNGGSDHHVLLTVYPLFAFCTRAGTWRPPAWDRCGLSRKRTHQRRVPELVTSGLRNWPLVGRLAFSPLLRASDMPESSFPAEIVTFVTFQSHWREF